MKSKFKEKRILAGLKDKDKDAFTAVYDEYVDKIYRFVYFKIGSKEAAEDLTSSVFLKAWNHIQENSLKDIKGLKALLYAISRNAIIDHYRKQCGREEVPLYQDSVLGIEGECDLAGQMDKDFKNNLVTRKLLKLKDEYREVIMLRFIEEYSIGEIADIIGKPKGNVRVILHRGMKALRELCGENEEKVESRKK